LNLTGTNRTNLVLNDVGTAYSHFQLVQLLRSVDTLDEVGHYTCLYMLPYTCNNSCSATVSATLLLLLLLQWLPQSLVILKVVFSASLH
jgi:hypothetical protein